MFLARIFGAKAFTSALLLTFAILDGGEYAADEEDFYDDYDADQDTADGKKSTFKSLDLP